MSKTTAPFYNANALVAYLQKPTSAFTKADILRFVAENGIRMLNFLYTAGDGRLKTLNFVITDRAYLDTLLSCGERVDGSSLFRFIGAGSSDLYVLPRFSTAFVDPFAEIPTLCLLCSYFDKDGRPLASSSEQTLLKAAEAFREVTGMEFEAMGELEYYVIKPDEERYPAVDQRAYHESAPFAKTNAFRAKCMLAIAQTGAQIKYGHSEVGNFAQDGLVYEQNEIEFLPVPVREAADQLVIAKWIIRNLAYEEGLNVTFAPGCRNNWHIHHKAVQVLICVAGRGWYQEWGKEAVEMKPGTVIAIPEGVKHWHGAARDSWMQHLTYNTHVEDSSSNEWLESVTDDIYDKLK